MVNEGGDGVGGGLGVGLDVNSITMQLHVVDEDEFFIYDFLVFCENVLSKIRIDFTSGLTFGLNQEQEWVRINFPLIIMIPMVEMKVTSVSKFRPSIRSLTKGILPNCQS